MSEHRPDFGPDLGEVFGPHQADGGPQLVQLLTPEGERVEHPDFTLDLGDDEAATIRGFYPRLAAREGRSDWTGALYSHVQSRIHVAISRRYFMRGSLRDNRRVPQPTAGHPNRQPTISPGDRACAAPGACG